MEKKQGESGGRMKKCEYENHINELVVADFYGIYQYADVLRPEVFNGGHNGGMRAWPMALVLGENGMEEIDPIFIKKIYEVEE